MADATTTYTIEIKTLAELTAAKNYRDELAKQAVQAKLAGQAAGHLEQQIGRLNSSIAQATPKFSDVFGKVRQELSGVIPGFAQLDGFLSKFAGGTLGAIAGGFAAVAGAIGVAKNAVLGFARAEQSVARLDAALAQSGRLTDEYRQKLQELANALEESTTIDDDHWISVLTRLTQFGAGPENIEQYAEAVKNLAGIMGGDVESAASVFARAIQGNFEMLGRYGIHVDESKTKTAQLNDVMQELAQRGAGQLEARGEGLSGQWRRLTNAGSDLSKNIGRLIADTGILQASMGYLAEVSKYWGDEIDGVIPKAGELENALSPTTTALDDASVAAGKFGDKLKDAEKDLATYIGRLKELQRIQDELEDADMALDLARVDEEKGPESGKLQKKAAIRERYAQKKFDREQSTIQKTIDANDTFYRQAEVNALTAGQAVQDQKEKIVFQKEIEKAQADLKGASQTTATAAGKHMRALELLRRSEFEPGSGGFGDKGNPAQADVDDALAELNRAKGTEQSLKEKLQGLLRSPHENKSSAQLQNELDELQKRSKGADEDLNDAYGRRQENDILRRRFETNPRIFNSRTTAQFITDRESVRGAQEKEGDATINGQKFSSRPPRGSEGAAVAGAIRDGTAIMDGLFNEIMEAVKEQNSKLSLLRERVNNTRNGN